MQEHIHTYIHTYIHTLYLEKPSKWVALKGPLCVLLSGEDRGSSSLILQIRTEREFEVIPYDSYSRGEGGRGRNENSRNTLN